VCVSEGSPFSWWLGGAGAGGVQTYWGGAQPGSRQCACGLRGDCVEPHHYCNCDADREEWCSTFISLFVCLRVFSGMSCCCECPRLSLRICHQLTAIYREKTAGDKPREKVLFYNLKTI